MPKYFTENIIALIMDFDKTLIPGNMQKPLFLEYGVDEERFWQEVGHLQETYAASGIRVLKDTVYLNHILTYVREGIFRGLNNAKLRDYGQSLEFYPGIPQFFANLKRHIEENERYKNNFVKLEFYIVSTGLTETIRGSIVNDYVDGIWGCEFIEDPAKPNYLGFAAADAGREGNSAGRVEAKERGQGGNEVTQIGYQIDNTSKTRAIFEINKGSNKEPSIDVNAKMRGEERRVPFRNMIYMADGPSDVPAFSVVKQNGGKTYAVYNQNKEAEFKQVVQLLEDGRIDAYGEAHYEDGSPTVMWLKMQLTKIADRICAERERVFTEIVSLPPRHVN